MANNCSCSGGVKIILACSGASNVGQITNEVAKKMDIEEHGKFACLAGVGGRISGIVASIEGSDEVLVIDGCSVACAKLTMEAAGLTNYQNIIVTDLGIAKNHNFALDESDIAKTFEVCCKKLNQAQESTAV